MELLHPGDSFEVDKVRDFNSAKSSCSQYNAKHPEMIFTQRLSCARCGSALPIGKGRSSAPKCRCPKGKPKKLLTIKKWS